MDENLSRGYCQLPDFLSNSPERDRHGGLPSNSRETGTSSRPKDNCSCIYLGLLFCGAGFLLPYNSFITAVDYYLDRYPESTIIFDMSLTYICMALFSVIINNIFVELLPLHARITFGYVISFLTLFVVAILDIWLKMFTKEMSYTVTLIAVATVSVGCTVQQSSFYGYTSMLPARYTQAVMVGESAAGLLVSINRILTKALMPNSVTLNTLIFFILSMVSVFACCVIFHVTRKSKFARYYVASCKSAGVQEDQRGIAHASSGNPEEVDIMDGHVSRDSYGVLVINSPTTPPGEQNHQTPAPSGVSTDVVIKDAESRIQGQGHSYRRHLSTWHAIKRGCAARYHVSRTIWPYMLAIGSAYFVTLCLFPGIESEIVSCWLGSWMPVLLISVFNLFDFVGKIIASAPYDWPRCHLVFCTFLRIMIVPLLMLCATPREQPLVRGEFWPFIFTILLGISNGYFGSVPMILAPARVPDEQKELSGNIMTLSYSIGLTSGSAVAYFLDSLLGDHHLDPCHYNNTGSTHIIGYNITTLNHLFPVPPNDIFSP